jgi:hypothetical protein
MLALGVIAFAHPWLLTALLLLPALWWLLRITPPSPRHVRFPAIRLLLDLLQREETAARTPPWLIALRLLLAGLIILALADPILNPLGGPGGKGPLLLLVDNGWAAARDWPARTRMLTSLLESAEREGRPVMLLPTAAPASGEPVQASKLLAASEAGRPASALAPEPWPVDLEAARAALANTHFDQPASVVWLSDGIQEPGAMALATRLQQLGQVLVMADPPDFLPHLLLPPARQGPGLVFDLVRASAEKDEALAIRALDEQGHPITEAPLAFPAGKRNASVKLELPVELRNEVARVEILGERSAAATLLLDERWRRRPVGIVSASADQAEPLLGGTYYLNKALAPYSEVRPGTLDQLLSQELAVLVVTDKSPLPPAARDEIAAWIQHGGTLLRFAGPRLAEADDALVPVQLRKGAREMGGAMSWSQPAALAAFDARSPFVGLEIPGDVAIKRQVLAEPSLDLDGKTWARLADGTPLVTAAKQGKGWLILVHTTADPDWSTLPLSGLFVEMLQRVVALSQGVASGRDRASLPPFRTLDGFGEFAPPPPAASALTAEDLAHPVIGPRHPPGYYGTALARRALNLTGTVSQIAPLGALPDGIERRLYGAARERDLKPWLLEAGLLLAFIDLLIGLWLRGLLAGRRSRQAAGGALFMLAAILLAPSLAHAADPSAQAQGPAQAPPNGVPAAPAGPGANAASGDDAFAIAATGSTRLAYVITGDAQLDATSKAGLLGLALVLTERTAVEAGAPMGLDVEKDELAFFPLLYWPIPDSPPQLSPHAIEKLSDYMRNGGQIMFDARDPSRDAPSWKVLQQLLTDLDAPPLTLLPEDHVLGRSFYLLRDFPGRLAGSSLWVERSEGNVNDGVSALVIGGNDWAGAWAVDEAGRPLQPVIPGGERQREMAYRFGINLVMYALTGNYKADQVHLPAILERLGL